MTLNIKEAFEKFNNENFFSRVDSCHPLELHIGMDEKGRKAIELRSKFIPRKVTGTAAIEVNQYSKSDYNTIRFSLIDEEISGLFYMFCEDLIKYTREIEEKSSGYTEIINRFFQWKRMFVSSKNSLLTEPEIMGLIGEVLYLKGSLASRIGLYDALKSWSGQELTHKDFSYNDMWAEVKTVKNGNTTVKISSLEQLDSDNDGELAVYVLEKMSETYNGVTLNKLVLETKDMFDSREEMDLFMSKVALQGYEYNDIYDEYVYEISDFRRYSVNEYFPKLTARVINPAIKKASYEIALTDIAEFEI